MAAWIVFFVKPILLSATQSTNRKENKKKHPVSTNLLGLNIFYFIYMKRDWANEITYVR